MEAEGWFSRRWFEFRTGYSMYLIFMVGFSNFVLILYNFVPEVKEYVSLYTFVAITGVAILPAAVLMGRMHHRKQIPTENVVMAKNNPYAFKIHTDSMAEFHYRLLQFQLMVLRDIAKGGKYEKEFDEWEGHLKDLLGGSTTDDIFRRARSSGKNTVL